LAIDIFDLAVRRLGVRFFALGESAELVVSLAIDIELSL
jgi:hypothetical protein